MIKYFLWAKDVICQHFALNLKSSFVCNILVSHPSINRWNHIGKGESAGGVKLCSGLVLLLCSHLRMVNFKMITKKKKKKNVFFRKMNRSVWYNYNLIFCLKKIQKENK